MPRINDSLNVIRAKPLQKGNMMSETVAEQSETVVPSVEVDANGVPTSITDDFGRMGYAKALEQSTALKSLNDEIAALTGKTSAMKDALKASFGSDSDSTDEDKKLAAVIEELGTKLLKAEQIRDSKIDAKITETTAKGSETVAPKISQRDEIKKAVNALRTILSSTYGEDALYGLPKVSAGSTNAGAPSGQPRLRGLNVTVNNVLATSKDKDGNEKSSLSAGAKAAKVETTVLRDAFYSAAGTKDANSFPESTDFQIVGSDNVTYNVNVSKQAE